MTTITRSKLAMMNKVLETFNFEKVALVMHTLNWQWATVNETGYLVPTIAKLQAMARHLMFEAIEGEVCFSGGLCAKYNKANEDEEESFELEFILTRTRSYDK